jgi:hypothetical protein
VADVDQFGQLQQILAGVQKRQLAAVAGREFVYRYAWSAHLRIP